MVLIVPEGRSEPLSLHGPYTPPSLRTLLLIRNAKWAVADRCAREPAPGHGNGGTDGGSNLGAGRGGGSGGGHTPKQRRILGDRAPYPNPHPI